MAIESASTPELLHILFGGARGGCEGDALQLMRNLPSVRHRVVLLGPRGPICEDWERAGAHVESVGKPALRDHEVYDAIQSFVAHRPPSAAMIWHGMVHLPQLIHALNPLRIPIAVHGGNPAHTMPRAVDWKYVLSERLNPLGGPFPTYICCSQYVAESFETSHYLRRFPRVVIPNGVELPSGATHVPREIGPEGPIHIGMVARLNSIKDHPTLIRAMAAIVRRFPKAVLELAGDGEEALSLRQLASDLNLNGPVRFLGDVSDVYGQMARWDLFAYATTEREGLGNAVAEAMMFGLPCVITDVGPMHEFVGAGDAVKLVPPANPTAMAEQICALIPDFAARSHLSSQGRAHALANFRPEVFGNRYAEILKLLPDSNDA